jgi:lysophospholipase L1-like esterase
MFIRRTFAALRIGLALLSLVSTAPNASAAEPVEQQTLGRAFAKLAKEKKLKLAYLGGPITAGADATSSWRAQTTAWFQRNFPQAKVSEVNAAAGGGSEYGAFRFRKDVMVQDPDVVFVEFAVDDAERDERRVLRSLEGIVRQYWTANPWGELVFVYTASKRTAPGLAAGEVAKSVAAHQAIAKHYGIPAIDVGGALAEAMKSGATWETLTTDGAQPNAAGTAVYMRAIEAFLAAQQKAPAGQPLVVLPEPLAKDPFSGAYVAGATSSYAPGWRKEMKPTDDSPRYIEADQPGTELEHTFTGTTVGLFLVVGPDGGDLECRINDGPPQRISSFELKPNALGRVRCVILADDLASSKEHKLTLRILPEKQPESKGTKIRLAAVFTHCDC